MKNITIFLDGYWRESNKQTIPFLSGIYCVYEGGYDLSKRMLQVHRLLYIGMADNIREAIEHHPDYDMWLAEVLRDRELLFSVGSVSPEEERERALKALIYQHTPVVNMESSDGFPFSNTSLLLLGKNALLSSNFTVYRTREPMPEKLDNLLA